MLNIKSTDKVLEIGSGNRPRKRSDVLCDKFIADDTERSGGDAVMIDKRPFVIADGVALPFKDKSFDYVITSHILEHVADPHAFVAELVRVARGGYIETPSELFEKLFGWQFHKWIVRVEGDTIVIRARMESSPFGNFFHNLYSEDLWFAEFVDSHFQDFYVQYEWQHTIRLVVENSNDSIVRMNSGMKRVETRSRLRMFAISLLRSVTKTLLRLLGRLRRFDR
jgi:ubiquinone/menaquinone biosynthesis C-methylase UbiE